MLQYDPMSQPRRLESESRPPSTETLPYEVIATIDTLLTNLVLHRGGLAVLWQGIEAAKSAQSRAVDADATQPFAVSAEVSEHLRQGLKMLDILLQQLRAFYQDETQMLHSLVPLNADRWLHNFNALYATDEPRSQYRHLLRAINRLQAGLENHSSVDPGDLSAIESHLDTLADFVNANLIARWKEDWTANKLARLDQQEQQLVLLGYAAMIPAEAAQLRRQMQSYAANKFR